LTETGIALTEIAFDYFTNRLDTVELKLSL